MIIPVFTRQQFTDQGGFLEPSVQNNLDVFFQQCQENISDNGLVAPSQTTAFINDVASDSENAMPNGTLWYDTDANKLKVKINGTVRIVTTS